ncbi:PA2169 family four-helix-bundle protein [Paraburkholderia humisilvae]|uniref:DUF2383 domain-containing protein n=1 Tax=Paraburkholderia humisilvae TaxID=627669 RepID=A0A6J5F612_9BURK|nr:PA2169 family four-helix-bundle protein [Paraburkholderia humisilvae]CAB3772765.1 hypothetical protein LMG29542_06966 [Paraburkholderia humisilvae]
MSTNVIAVINELIETSKDGERGFLKAAQDAHDAQLKEWLSARADTCTRAARELQDIVMQLGGKPENGGSVSGALHRGWVDLKSAVGSRSDHAILADCEKGEDVAKKRYQEALAKDLPADVRTLIERQFHGVMLNHDQIRDLRDRHAAARS